MSGYGAKGGLAHLATYLYTKSATFNARSHDLGRVGPVARKTSDRVMTTFTGRSPALRDPAASHLGRAWSAEPARIAGASGLIASSTSMTCGSGSYCTRINRAASCASNAEAARAAPASSLRPWLVQTSGKARHGGLNCRGPPEALNLKALDSDKQKDKSVINHCLAKP